MVDLGKKFEDYGVESIIYTDIGRDGMLTGINIEATVKLAQALTIPVIGIGAGADTDGQILVMHDLLGISTGYIPKFSKNFLQETGDIKRAISKYIADVKQGSFPGPEHSFN